VGRLRWKAAGGGNLASAAVSEVGERNESIRPGSTWAEIMAQRRSIRALIAIDGLPRRSLASNTSEALSRCVGATERNVPFRGWRRDLADRCKSRLRFRLTKRGPRRGSPTVQ
jgi:hypothetical protein